MDQTRKPRRGRPRVFGVPAPTSAWTTFGASPSKPKLPPAPQGSSSAPTFHRNEGLHALLLKLVDDKSQVRDVLNEMEHELRSEILTSPSYSRSGEQRSKEAVEGSQFKRERLREFERMVGHHAANDTEQCPRCAVFEERLQLLSKNIAGQDAKNCGSCIMLGEKLEAVVQSLAGLGHSMLKWSETLCVDHIERTAMWEALLNLLDPVRNVDIQLANILKKVESMCISPPSLRTLPKHAGQRQLDPREAPRTSETASSLGSMPPLVQSKALPQSFTAASSRLDPPSNGYAPLPTEVTVQFTATAEARNLSGVYSRIPGLKICKRPVYARGLKHLVHLADGTWVIKDGPEDDVEADVYSYVRDFAESPTRIERLWQVPCGIDGFVTDEQGSILPGRVDAVERAAAKRDEGQLHHGASQAEAETVAAVKREEAQLHHGAAPVAAAAVTPRHRLILKICSAEGLKDSDGAFGGASDPYCICEVPGKPKSKITTKVIQNTSTPTWDHEQEVLDWSPGDSLHFSVWDDDVMGDDILGRSELKPADFWPMGFVGTVNLADSEAKLNIEVIVPR